jgi:hypothetical protein
MFPIIQKLHATVDRSLQCPEERKIINTNLRVRADRNLRRSTNQRVGYEILGAVYPPHSAQDMVILHGQTTNSNVYILFD